MSNNMKITLKHFVDINCLVFIYTLCIIIWYLNNYSIDDYLSISTQQNKFIDNALPPANKSMHFMTILVAI